MALTYQHRTQQKRPERTHHDQASSYKQLCKERATELYQLLLKNEGLQQRKIIFHTFKNIFYKSVLLSFTKIFDVIVLFQCFTVTLTKCNSNNIMLPCPASTKFYLPSTSVLLNRILNQTSFCKKLAEVIL